MQTYQLRSKDELLEDARLLGLKRKAIEQEYQLKMKDIEADIATLKAECDLLKSIGGL